MIRFEVLLVISLCWRLTSTTLVRLDDLDSRLTWTPQITQTSESCRGQSKNNLCTGFWWTEQDEHDFSGSSHHTWGPDTSVSFTFRGSSFMIFGPTFWAGAAGFVSVDGNDTGSFTTMAANVIEPLRQQLVYMLGDLNATEEHTVVIKYDQRDFDLGGERRWLGLDFILIDELAQSSELGSGYLPSQGLPPPPPGAEPPTITGAMLGLVVAASLLGLFCLALSGLLLIVLRGRKEDKLDRMANVLGGGLVEPAHTPVHARAFQVGSVGSDLAGPPLLNSSHIPSSCASSTNTFLA